MFNIKISPLHSILHESNTFTAENNAFLKEIEEKLGEKLVLSDIQDYECDLKLIFIESGGSERLFLDQIDKLKKPFYFLTSGTNNSLAASLEILAYLNNHGIKGEIIHGTTDYIASRIKQLVKNNKVMNYIGGSNFGVIGRPSDWLISSIPGYNQIKDIFDIHLVNIPLEEIYQGVTRFDNFELDKTYPLEYDKKQLNEANKVYLALDSIVKKHNLNGLTVRCFDLLDKLHTTGCLGLSYLNSKGIIATCEGDIMAMISMFLIRAISGKSSFQANPSRIDTQKNEIVFAHCTAPFNMLESYKIDSHFESKIGVAIKGSDPQTVYSLLYYITFEFNRTSFNEIYNMNLTYDDEGTVIRYIFYTVAYEIYIFNIFPFINKKLCIDKVNKIIYKSKNLN